MFNIEFFAFSVSLSYKIEEQCHADVVMSLIMRIYDGKIVYLCVD